MYCGSCGTNNKDGAKFCCNCGAKLEEQHSTYVPAQESSNHRKRGSLVLVLAVLAIVVITATVLIIRFSGRGYKETVKQYVSASFEADFDSIIGLIPEKIFEHALEEENYKRSDLLRMADEATKNLFDTYNDIFGRGWEYSYEIVNEEDIVGEDFKDLKYAYEDNEVTILDAKKIRTDITITGTKNTRDVSIELSLVKIGNSWYIDILGDGVGLSSLF